jgi:hypothetical protein
MDICLVRVARNAPLGAVTFTIQTLSTYKGSHNRNEIRCTSSVPHIFDKISASVLN